VYAATFASLHLPAWQAGLVFGAAGVGGLLASAAARHDSPRAFQSCRPAANHTVMGARAAAPCTHRDQDCAIIEDPPGACCTGVVVSPG
jgi:hypothetical protein